MAKTYPVGLSSTIIVGVLCAKRRPSSKLCRAISNTNHTVTPRHPPDARRPRPTYAQARARKPEATFGIPRTCIRPRLASALAAEHLCERRQLERDWCRRRPRLRCRRGQQRGRRKLERDQSQLELRVRSTLRCTSRTADGKSIPTPALCQTGHVPASVRNSPATSVANSTRVTPVRISSIICASPARIRSAVASPFAGGAGSIAGGGSSGGIVCGVGGGEPIPVMAPVRSPGSRSISKKE